MPTKYSFIVIALLIILALSGCNNTNTYKTSVQEERMDFSGWDFSTQGNVSLDGNWAFYWSELLSPGSFSDAEPTGYFYLPFYWTKHEEQFLPSYGYATYRLDVKTDGVPRLYGIKTPEIYTEYVLWVDGKLLGVNGSFVGKEPVYLHPQTFDFYSQASNIEIVLQVKNYAHVYGGVGQSIRLGTSELIHKEQNTNTAVDIILISICLFVGFYYAILYCFWKISRELIWFSLLCLSVAVRNLFSNTTLIMQMFPDMPFWIGSKLVTLTIPVIIISMLFYTERLFKNEMPSLAFKSLLWVNIIYTLAVAVTPSGVYSFIFVPYLLSVGAACGLGICTSVKALKCRKGEAAFFFAGMLLLTAGAVIDTLIFLQFINFCYVLSATLFGFIILQVILLAKRYAEAFNHSELLSKDLQASLDKLTNTETAFMSAQMKPHFLYNALTAIAEKCKTDSKEAGNLIISLSKYLRQTLNYDTLSGIVSLKKELELIYAYTSIECARFANIEVVFDLPNPLPQMHLPPLTLQPLVENAIKHGLRKKSEGGSVIVRANEQSDRVIFIVEDNGIGMPENMLDNLLVLPSGNASIGLYNINARLVRLYGKGLCISSKSGAGTRVSFEIPLRKDD